MMYYYSCGDRLPLRPPTYARRRVSLQPRRCYSSNALIEPLLSILLSEADRLTLGQTSRGVEDKSKARHPASNPGNSVTGDCQKAVHRRTKTTSQHRCCPYYKPGDRRCCEQDKTTACHGNVDKQPQNHEEVEVTKENKTTDNQGNADKRVPVQNHKVAEAKKENEHAAQHFWTERISCNGFRPKELRVRLKGGKLQVHAKRRSRHDGQTETYTFRRTIQLPSDVDGKELQCGFTTQPGSLVLHAPKLVIPDNKEAQNVLSSQQLQAEPAEKVANPAPSKVDPRADGEMPDAHGADERTAETPPAKRKPDVPEGDTTTKKLKLEIDEDVRNTGPDPAPSVAEPLPLLKEAGEEHRTEEMSTPAESIEDVPQTESTQEAAECVDDAVATDAEVQNILHSKDIADDTTVERAESPNADRPRTPTPFDDTTEESRPENDSTDSAAPRESTSAKDTVNTLSDTKPRSPTPEVPGTAPGDVNRHEESCNQATSSVLPAEKKPYSITVHVPDFLPEELHVTVQKSELTIAAERRIENGGFFGVEKFQRRLLLPAHIDPAKLECVARDDGTLTVTAV
ncbi:hypothetical protein BaRGS_00014458 [Batillaria attramentaria]|uniref:SHSP domain-containing protein n=1 Tax=Batillaria attramentaria TaxID=370345 RepID=A0ABD0L4R2_9CAEN